MVQVVLISYQWRNYGGDQGIDYDSLHVIFSVIHVRFAKKAKFRFIYRFRVISFYFAISRLANFTELYPLQMYPSISNHYKVSVVVYTGE